MNNPTSVICVRGKSYTQWVADVPRFRYVGRRNRNGFPETPFGNPFRVGVTYTMGDGQSITWREPRGVASVFARCLWDTLRGEPLLFPDLADYFAGMVRVMPRLEGCVLGCWCGSYSMGSPMTPVPCHAVPIAILVNSGMQPPDLYQELLPWISNTIAG